MNANAPASDAENANRVTAAANAMRPKRYNTRAASRRALADVSNRTTTATNAHVRASQKPSHGIAPLVSHRDTTNTDGSKKPRLNEDVVARRTRSSASSTSHPPVATAVIRVQSDNVDAANTIIDDIDNIDTDIDILMDRRDAITTSTTAPAMLPPPHANVATTITEHDLSDPVVADAYACSLSLPWGVVDIDAATEHGYETRHLQESTLAIAIHRAQLSREVSGMTMCDYLSVRQCDVTARMRTILVDWLVDVHMQFRLQQSALYLAVNIFDRFLSTEDTVVARSQLQLVGVTCMWIAAKYEEIYPPCLEDFVYISDCTYTRDELLRMEALICNKLNFVFTVPTVLPFVDRGLKALFAAHPQYADSKKNISSFSNYALELALCDYNMCKYRPSMLAAAAIALAAHTLAYCQLAWDNTMRFHTGGYTVDALNSCARDLWKIIQKDCEQNNPKICAVRRKYSHDKFHRVALVAATLKFDHTNNTTTTNNSDNNNNNTENNNRHM